MSIHDSLIRSTTHCLRRSCRWFSQIERVIIIVAVGQTLLLGFFQGQSVEAQEPTKIFPPPLSFDAIELSKADITVLVVAYPQFVQLGIRLDNTFPVLFTETGEAIIANPLPFSSESAVQQDITEQLSFITEHTSHDNLVEQNQTLVLTLTAIRQTDISAVAIVSFHIFEEVDNVLILKETFRFTERSLIQRVEIQPSEEAMFLFVDTEIINAFQATGVEIEEDTYILTAVTKAIHAEKTILTIQAYADERGTQVRFVEAGLEQSSSENLGINTVVISQPIELAMTTAEDSAEHPTPEELNALYTSWQETEVQGYRFIIGTTVPGLEFHGIQQRTIERMFGQEYLNLSLERNIRVEWRRIDQAQADLAVYGNSTNAPGQMFHSRDSVRYLGVFLPNSQVQGQTDRGEDLYIFYIDPSRVGNDERLYGPQNATSIEINITSMTLALIASRERNERFDLGDYIDTIIGDDLKGELDIFMRVSS